jgi:hypothetical protein
VHYGLALEHLALPRVHRNVEGDHRAAGWRVMREHIAAPARRGVVDAVRAALDGWLAYKESVARACGLKPPRGA